MRHFTVLADTLNVRRAAERLNMAQPPLSVSIQKLEAELGLQLFNRHATGVSLTASGRELLAEARRLLYQGDRIRELAQTMLTGVSGVLQIGFVGSATYGMLQRLLPRFRAEHPGVELSLREATSVVILQLLKDSALDIGLVRVPLLEPTDMKLLPLEYEDYVAALPRSNPLARRAMLKLSALANEPFIMYAASSAAGLHGTVMFACQQAGFVPKVAQQAVQVQTVLALVESGLGVALVPSRMQQFSSERIVYRPIADLPASASIGLALAYDGDSESAAAARFRSVAEREFAGAPMPAAKGRLARVGRVD